MEHDGDSCGSENEFGTEKKIGANSTDLAVHEAEGGIIGNKANDASSLGCLVVELAENVYEMKKHKKRRRKSKRAKSKTIDAVENKQDDDGNSTVEEKEENCEPLIVSDHEPNADAMDCHEGKNSVKTTVITNEENPLTTDAFLENEIIHEISKNDVKYKPKEKISSGVNSKTETVRSDEIKQIATQFNPIDSKQFRRCAAVFDVEPLKQEENLGVQTENEITSQEKSITILYQARTEFNSETSVAGSLTSKSQDLADTTSQGEAFKIPSTVIAELNQSCSTVLEPADTAGVELQSESSEMKSKAEKTKHEQSDTKSSQIGVSKFSDTEWTDISDDEYIQKSSEMESKAEKPKHEHSDTKSSQFVLWVSLEATQGVPKNSDTEWTDISDDYTEESEDNGVKFYDYDSFGAEPEPIMTDARTIRDNLIHNLRLESEAAFARKTLAQQLEIKLMKHLNDPSPVNKFEQDEEISVEILQVPNPSLMAIDENEAKSPYTPTHYSPLDRFTQNLPNPNTLRYSSTLSQRIPGENPSRQMFKPCSEAYYKKFSASRNKHSSSTIRRGLRRVSRAFRNCLCLPNPSSSLEPPPRPTFKESFEIFGKAHSECNQAGNNKKKQFNIFKRTQF